MPIFRVRQLANSKWVCEQKKFFRWFGLCFSTNESRLSYENNSECISISLHLPNTNHYSVCWCDDKEDAHSVMNQALALYGI